MVGIITFFIVLYRLIPLVKIKNTIFRKVLFFDTKVTRLLLKITIFRPYVNGICLKITFLFSYCYLNPLSEKIFFDMNILFKFLMA